MSQKIVRQCLAAINPEIDFEHVGQHEHLLENRLLNSFKVLDLLLYLENHRGYPIRPDELKPGNFRDIATIAEIFLGGCQS